MKQLHLLDIFKSPPSPDIPALIAEIKSKHGILSYRSPRVSPPWIAILPIEDHKGQDIVSIMAEWCGAYEDDDRVGYGGSEFRAVQHLMEKRGIPFAR